MEEYFGKKEKGKKADFITENTPNPVVFYIKAEGKHTKEEISQFFIQNGRGKLSNALTISNLDKS